MSVRTVLLTISVAIIASVLSYSERPRHSYRTGFETQKKPCIQPVNLDVYYESRCNASQDFILKQLLPLAHREFTWLHITLIPYGTATFIEGKAACLHGAAECLMNRFQVCSLKRMTEKGPGGDLKRVLLAMCMMSSFNEDAESIAKRCVRSYDLNWGIIRGCAEGEEGIELQTEYIDRIHKEGIPYVPFVAFNKQSGPKYYQYLALQNLELLAIDVHNCDPVPPVNCTSCCPIKHEPTCSCGHGGPCCEFLAKGYQYEDRHIIRMLPPIN